jgi:outer membrane protein assembly factor BamB
MNRMSPLVSESMVFQGNNLGSFVALDRKSGRVQWRKEFKGGVEAGATLFKNQVFVAANDGTISALNAKNGDQIWSFSSSSENVSIPVLDTSTGLLYFQNSQNLVFCLEADTGRQVWVYSKPDNTLMTIRGSSTPTVANGLVFVGFSEGSFVALNAKTGQVAWEQALNRNKKFKDVDAQAVVVSPTVVVVSGYDDRVYALSQSQGQILWSYNAGSYSAVTLDGKFIYVSTTDSKFLKLNVETGELVWKLDDIKGLATQSVVTPDHVVFGESQGSVLFVDKKTGQKVNQYQPGRGVFSMPKFIPQTSEIYFISGEAYVYSLLYKPQRLSRFSWL